MDFFLVYFMRFKLTSSIGRFIEREEIKGESWQSEREIVIHLSCNIFSFYRFVLCL